MFDRFRTLFGHLDRTLLDLLDDALRNVFQCAVLPLFVDIDGDTDDVGLLLKIKLLVANGLFVEGLEVRDGVYLRADVFRPLVDSATSDTAALLLLVHEARARKPAATRLGMGG